MVGLGCGVGVVPELVLEKSPLQGRVQVTPIMPDLAPFIIGACTLERHLNNPVIQAFWATVHQVNRPED
jgi:LysR family positive regulator for ilvC